MTLYIDGNMFKGNLTIDTEISSDDFYNVVFNHNVVEGDMVFKTAEIKKDLIINGCSFNSDLQHMGPEAWFMYRNILFDKKDIK